MLGNISSIEQLGLYESAEKIVSIPLAIIATFGTVMLPRVTNLLANNNEEESNKYLEKASIFMVFICLPVILGLIVAFVLNVHDEYQAEVKLDLVEEYRNMAVEAIRKAGEYFNFRCPLDGEVKVGTNWYETH